MDFSLSSKKKKKKKGNQAEQADQDDAGLIVTCSVFIFLLIFFV